MRPEIIVKQKGLCPYDPCYQDMRQFTQQRGPDETDQIWLLQHPPIYTLGLAADENHILKQNAIEVARIDRGGQVTYHGPGQLILYPLINLKRLQCSMIDLVNALEQATLNLLESYGLQGTTNTKARGVYLHGAKIAALGLKVSKGCSYHGLALNVSNDLSPFEDINPCGYHSLKVTRLGDHVANLPSIERVGQQLVHELCRLLGYERVIS
jgi:lipoyl(octanoyl) transferase